MASANGHVEVLKELINVIKQNNGEDKLIEHINFKNSDGNTAVRNIFLIE